MNISDLFIRRPIMTSLVMLAVMIFGLFAYNLLPVNSLPNIDYPTIQVRSDLPGASPETMASAVATPLIRPPARSGSRRSSTIPASSSGRDSSSISPLPWKSGKTPW